ncbi:Rpn family recombination-promoting nuclease/putative transposase [Verminephrobacter aporrectodeae subsp. tuberculatae]|uniref:Rpn family recombination-promoting nuclease/putative transposase n=1 Tax=Verminephrobacter aporrectodeae TaxID=1110389 RepID=UPI0022376949|nr:Rpn family recombination-promoting nuclease/putative transposase [Verminephrobacter aporrectodeae]MCW5219829.1 Rpn family recombination-promoting nuclease/putative transposase [Verminephrobacter aporrectodeae subsp. tuberculatae]MCW5289117.1 Rpn family recombination-promoting nuclease/putative transposase [Verminephrobacter aporrectodeae subsp. tuberculatae]
MNLSYLDPKIDLVFKRVFSRANLLLDFLNAVLPLDAPIESLTYLPTEQAPQVPGMRFSIVDVKCCDQSGQVFIVEMQMLWTDAYFSRILFSGAQAIINQLSSGAAYQSLCRVYSVTVLNDVFEKAPSEKDRWLHHYKITRLAEHDKVLQGLQFVILELPKFTPQTRVEKQVTALWLRFLCETGKSGFVPDEAFLSYPPVANAVKLTEFKGYSAVEIESYQKYLDALSNEKSFLLDAETKGRAQGMEEGRVEGMEEGIEKGRVAGLQEGIEKGRLAVARNLLALLDDDEAIAQASGLALAAIKKLRQGA